MRFPYIDYEAHPAYSLHLSPSNLDNHLLDERSRAIDFTYATFCKLTAPTDSDVEDAMSHIRSCVDQINAHMRKQGASVVAAEWLERCTQWAIADLRYEMTRRLFGRREYQPKPLSDGKLEQLSTMRSRGMYVTDLSADRYNVIRQLSLQHLETLKRQALQDPFSRSVINVPFNTGLWRAIRRGMQEAGVFDVLDVFKGNRMTMLGAGLEYSCSEQRWYQGLYRDVGLTDSPLQYLHIDEGYCLPKAMIYITPVDEESGPTRAMPGSNCWECSEFRLRMFRALDRIVGDRYDRYGDQSNYRIMARHAELRRIFMQLPAVFRGSSHFGDDVLPDSDLARELQRLESPYLSCGAQTLVFDGPHLLHRGSLVRAGERLALQVIFRNRNEASIRAHIAKETFVKEQLALGRKYARKFVMNYL